MKAKIAVVTVSGKEYYLIVNELKRKNIPFLSLTPFEQIPIEVEVVITTERERPLLQHKTVLVFRHGMQPEAFVNEAQKLILGKDVFEKIIIGVDPGNVFGIAVLADGKIVETANCFSVEETTDKIVGIVEGFDGTHVLFIGVKIGDGVPRCTKDLLGALNESLPLGVTLEIVSENGTNRSLAETKHRRGLRDIASATQIAGRIGNRFPRSKKDETNGQERNNTAS